jgi:three-Cys-motif partner protein
MPVHSFGGAWTERKLSVVRRYLEIYAQALKNQPFQRIYVDAFAGWPAPGSEDTKFGVTMGLEVGHAEASVYAGVQA